MSLEDKWKIRQQVAVESAEEWGHGKLSFFYAEARAQIPYKVLFRKYTFLALIWEYF